MKQKQSKLPEMRMKCSYKKHENKGGKKRRAKQDGEKDNEHEVAERGEVKRNVVSTREEKKGGKKKKRKIKKMVTPLGGRGRHTTLGQFRLDLRLIAAIFLGFFLPEMKFLEINHLQILLGFAKVVNPFFLQFFHFHSLFHENPVHRLN